MRISRFTPPATQLFNLIATDIGRPISDITLKVTDPELLLDAEQVLRNLAPREKEVKPRTAAGGSGASFLTARWTIASKEW